MTDRAPSSDPNEAPLVEELRDGGPVRCEPRAVAGGRRSVTTLAGWAVAIVVVIGIGAAGQRIAVSPDGLSFDAPPSGQPSLAPDPTDPTDPVASSAPAGVDAIVVRSPGWDPVVVTTRLLYVEGIVNVRAVSIQVALEAPEARIVASKQVSLPSVGDGVRPDLPPSFGAWFGLPSPRPNGTMWIAITAFGPDGRPVAAMRRPFLVGPVLEAGVIPPP